MCETAKNEANTATAASSRGTARDLDNESLQFGNISYCATTAAKASSTCYQPIVIELGNDNMVTVTNRGPVDVSQGYKIGAL